MSLVPVALRIIAENLLKNMTWAEDQILNMPMFPLAEVMKRAQPEQKPIIAVFTPSMDMDPLGRDIDDGLQSIKLQFYIYVSPGKTSISTDEFQLSIDMTNVPTHLGIIARQIMTGLKSQKSAWSRLWAKFAVEYKEASSEYVLHEVEAGVPIPCLSITLSVSALPEPDIGSEPNPIWAEFLEALQTVEDGDQWVTVLRSSIVGDEDIPDYDLVRRQTGVSEVAAVNAGINPLPETVTDDEPAVLTDINFTDDPDA